MRSATSRAAFSRARSPTSRPAGWASCAARRSIACSCARTASVVIRPPSRVRTRRSRIISRATASASSGWHLPGGLLQRDRAQITRLRRRRAARSASPRCDPRPRRSTWRARMRRSAARPRRARTRGGDRSRAHTRCRSAAGGQLLGAAVLEREVAQLPALRCPAVAGTETLRCPGDLTASARRTPRISSRGTPAISKYRPSLPVPLLDLRSPPRPAPRRARSGRTRPARARERKIGREATATIRSSSRTAPVMTTWLCSCGSGACAPVTPRAVVCRYSAAITSLACSSTTWPP